jgi:peptidoglycan hydrolase-like protein with peptidoglycan-binding domain
MPPRTTARALAWLLAGALALLAPPSIAEGAQNGRLPASALAPIHVPQNTAALARDAAAAWNTMRFCAIVNGQDLYPGASRFRPAATAYRTLEVQRILYRELGPRTAAYPGTSNHGWGLGMDLATLQMRHWIDRHGAAFGWAKRWSDAAHEWWHLRWRAGVWRQRPDPGLSQRYPLLRKGSGGRCLATAVREVQRRLGVTQDGEFGRKTAIALKRFERRAGLQVDGVVDVRTWRRLRAAGTRRAPATATSRWPASTCAPPRAC